MSLDRNFFLFLSANQSLEILLRWLWPTNYCLIFIVRLNVKRISIDTFFLAYKSIVARFWLIKGSLFIVDLCQRSGLGLDKSINLLIRRAL